MAHTHRSHGDNEQIQDLLEPICFLFPMSQQMPKLLTVHEVTALDSDMANLQDQGDSLSSSSQTQRASLRHNGQDTSPLGVPNPLSSRNHADVQTHEIEKVTDYQEPRSAPTIT